MSFPDRIILDEDATKRLLKDWNNPNVGRLSEEDIKRYKELNKNSTKKNIKKVLKKLIKKGDFLCIITI